MALIFTTATGTSHSEHETVTQRSWVRDGSRSSPWKPLGVGCVYVRLAVFGPERPRLARPIQRCLASSTGRLLCTAVTCLWEPGALLIEPW